MAGKLIITVGLPASGKSTWAAEQAAADPNVRVVTRDDIRLAIGAVWSAGDETVVEALRDDALARYYRKGYTVICADCNLSPKVRGRLRSVVAAVENNYEPVVEVKEFRTDLETCLTRNLLRHASGDFKVPQVAITKMHEDFIATGKAWA